MAVLQQRPVVMGVAGGSGSGKTTVVTAVVDAIGPDKVAVLPHDAYYHDLSNLPMEQRRVTNFDHRDRSLTSVLDQYESTVRPMHLEFVEPSKRWADILVPRGGGNEVAIDMLVRALASSTDLDAP